MMKKLKLDLEELRVESFRTVPDSESNRRGTVVGYLNCTGALCTALNPCQPDPTCATCGSTCDLTCSTCVGQATCDGTCSGPTCDGSKTCQIFCADL